MTILDAKKLLKGTQYELLSNDEVQSVINRLRPFMEIVAEKIIEYQGTIGTDDKTGSYFGTTLF